jgi:predicted nucleic acid-binding protein
LRQFFDSSVLIPVFYADHPHHAASTAVFLTARKQDSFCALTTLGEVYAVLTGMLLRPRISGKDGITILKQIRERLAVISLTEEEYFSALESVSASIVGGAALRCADCQMCRKGRRGSFAHMEPAGLHTLRGSRPDSENAA